MQSPVDIKTSLVSRDPQLTENPLCRIYLPSRASSLLNTGNGWKVLVEPFNAPGLKGGPLANSYQLCQFHSHWGKCPDSGSEHTVDGRAFAGELHFVYWNNELYESVEEATTSPKGLAVIGIFFQVGRENEELSKITEILHKIPYKNNNAAFDEEVDPAALFPDDPGYWTYEGSLTTPPYSESVTWIVFKKPIEVSESQLQTLRSMNSSEAIGTCDEGDTVYKKIEENCRKIQPLNGRVIREAPL